jgi:outer membrane protein TolC
LGFAQTPDDYFKVAAENNPGLQARYKEYLAAMEKIPQVSTLPDPELSFGYFIAPVETRVGPQQAKFSLTQMFPWFGSLKAQEDVAALKAEAKFQLFIDARNKLYFRVASAYYPLYKLKEWIRIEQENIAILKSYKTIATQKFKSGTGTMVDVLRVDMMLNESQTNLSILNQKEKPLVTTFNKLLNRAEDETVAIPDSLAYHPLSDNFRKDSLIATNPKLKALELRLAAGKSEELAAEKQGLPSIGVGLDYVMVGERSNYTPADNGTDALMAMVSLRIPIFRNKYKASVNEARLMQESYNYQKDQLANELLSDYEAVWFEIKQQEKLLQLYEKQIQTSQKSLELLYASYGNSGKGFEEVLRMQQQLLKYQKLKAEALTQYTVSVAKINYVTSKIY